MDAEPKIFLIDSNPRRRAAIMHCLASTRIYAEPFESIEEFMARNLTCGFALINDTDDAISTFMQSIVDSGSWVPVIGYCEQPSTSQVVDAILNGALHYLCWPFDENELARTIKITRIRAQAIKNRKLREASARSKISKLTRREREVLSGVVCGLSNRLIGEKLRISARTVEIHRANMLLKIRATHTSDAIRTAIEASFEV